MKTLRVLAKIAPAAVTSAASLFVTVAFIIAPSVRGNPNIVLTPIATDFNNPVGIDHHEPSKSVIMSVNYPTGQPYNFERVEADGTRFQFSTISGLMEELKLAAVRKGCCVEAFEVGEIFTGTGTPGVITRISPNGSTSQNPWVTLPGETGLLRGSLFQDRFCVCGGDLIVVTTHGNVWRVTSSGTPTKLASLDTHLEGLTTVPDDPAKYGPWAGKILVGAENAIDDQTQEPGLIYAIDCADGSVVSYGLGIRPEDVDIIPANQNFFGVDFGGRTLWGAAPSEFAGMVGDVLITQESPGILWHVRWDGSAFQKTEIARVTQWEHVTFSTAGLPDVLPVDPLLLAPPSAENPLGTDHTVAATIDDPAGAIPAGRLVQFAVIEGPNQGQTSDPGECLPNSDCTTDDNDQVSWTYTSNAQSGTDTIEACFIDHDCTQHCARVTKTWKDLTPPAAGCIETVNPHGKKVPPAGSGTLPGSNGGQNEDGFYRLMAEDDADPDPEIFLMDLGSGTVFGPFSSGTNIKYTEANGATPRQKKIGSTNGEAGAVAWHITGTGDAGVYAVDDEHNRSEMVFCLVPPIPK